MTWAQLLLLSLIGPLTVEALMGLRLLVRRFQGAERREAISGALFAAFLIPIFGFAAHAAAHHLGGTGNTPSPQVQQWAPLVGALFLLALVANVVHEIRETIKDIRVRRQAWISPAQCHQCSRCSHHRSAIPRMPVYTSESRPSLAHSSAKCSLAYRRRWHPKLPLAQDYP